MPAEVNRDKCYPDLACTTAGEFVLTPAQGCFRVPAASAEAVVLTLSGLTANVALQVTL